MKNLIGSIFISGFFLVSAYALADSHTKEGLLAKSENKALAGDPNGYYEVGIAYQNLPPISKQLGIPHELEKSLNYMWAGYRMGSAHAAHNLAAHYARGNGVPQDMNLASMLYADAVRLATDKQSRDFFVDEERRFRAMLFDQEVAQTEQIDKDSVCGRHPDSWECRFQANCALFSKKPDCSNGMSGMQAEQLLLRQIDNGDLTSTAFLALAYEAGIGIRQDLNKSLELYNQAIAGGNRTHNVIEGRERTLFLLSGGRYEDWAGK